MAGMDAIYPGTTHHYPEGSEPLSCSCLGDLGVDQGPSLRRSIESALRPFGLEAVPRLFKWALPERLAFCVEGEDASYPALFVTLGWIASLIGPRADAA